MESDDPPEGYMRLLTERPRYLRGYAQRFLGNDAEDCVQEAYLHAWRCWPPPHQRNLLGWMQTVVEGRVRNWHRNACALKRRPVPVPPTPVQRFEWDDALVARVNTYSPFVQQAIARILMYGESMEEAATHWECGAIAWPWRCLKRVINLLLPNQKKVGMPMIVWLKDLLWDSATFTQYARTGLAALWFAYESGLLPDAADGSALWYVSKACIVLAFVMRAGDKNAPR